MGVRDSLTPELADGVEMVNVQQHSCVACTCRQFWRHGSRRSAEQVLGERAVITVMHVISLSCR